MKEEEVFQKAGLTEDEIVVVRTRQRHYNTHLQQLHRLKELSGIPSFSRTDDEEVEYRKLNKLRTATLATIGVRPSEEDQLYQQALLKLAGFQRTLLSSKHYISFADEPSTYLKTSSKDI